MYEEPYRWVEAVGNRRQYLDEQFAKGSPVVGVACDQGILLITMSKGTPKLYEIYDRLALGGMGHPADLEKLRFTLLEMAHVEGFNRSASDVTGGRLVKYGVAPVVKQAFEEVFKAPFIVKIMLAELRQKAGKDGFLTINYDGVFEEKSLYAVLAATSSIEQRMTEYLRKQSISSLKEAVDIAIRTWAVGDRAQRQADEAKGDHEDAMENSDQPAADAQTLLAHVHQCMIDRSIECVLLDRQVAGTSKYRTLGTDELRALLPKDLSSAVT
ncbi:MAG: 20S proteasome subunit A/B [Nitrospira sp.]|nr:20S proteasome subunit A/B [Nitrospira sp.]MDH5194252.1 20S proteasome subunit A/B [Nitrospira sp.]